VTPIPPGSGVVRWLLSHDFEGVSHIVPTAASCAVTMFLTTKWIEGALDERAGALQVRYHFGMTATDQARRLPYVCFQRAYYLDQIYALY
jgi:hypothetical protein